jgi:hypothetical protein
MLVQIFVKIGKSAIDPGNPKFGHHTVWFFKIGLSVSAKIRKNEGFDGGRIYLKWQLVENKKAAHFVAEQQDVWALLRFCVNCSIM